MDDNHDHSDVAERLDHFESQMRQVRVLLIVLLLVVAIGLPGALSTMLGAGLTALLIGAAVASAWALLYLFDVVLLRRLREKREKEMQREILEDFHRSRTEEGK